MNGTFGSLKEIRKGSFEALEICSTNTSGKYNLFLFKHKILMVIYG